jgi:hypothetical protein
MELYEFTSLTEKMQIETARTGIFLAERADAVNHISLYNLGTFYVEIYHSVGLNKVAMVRAFKTTNTLAPYLEQFKDIKGLL